ncbi:hypothetical protein [Micromonospora sp. NPDC005171]
MVLGLVRVTVPSVLLVAASTRGGPSPGTVVAATRALTGGGRADVSVRF